MPSAARCLAAAAGVVGFALVLWIYHPGCIPSDGVDQLNQGRAGAYSDWHPPLMAWIWGRLDRFWPGAIGMLILQDACFWGGVAILSALALPGVWAPLACLLIGLFPPCFALLGIVWKDVQMGAALTLSFALLCLAERKGSRGWLAASLVPAFYAAAVRHNGPLVVVPLLGGVAWLWTDRAATGWARMLLTLTAGSLLLLVTIHQINRALTHGVTGYPHQQFMLHDLAGLSLAEGQSLLPEPWRDEASLTRMAELYRRENSDPLFWPTSPGSNLQTSGSRSHINALERAWFRAVSHHPGRYLRNRLAGFRVLLGFRTSTSPAAIFVGVDPNPWGIAWHWSEPCRWITERFSHIRNWLIFRPFVYLLAELGALLWLIWRRNQTVALPLVLSGLLNILPYLFVSPAPEFRYAWWTVVSTLLLPLAWRFGRLERARHSAPAPAGRPVFPAAAQLGSSSPQL